MRAAVERLCPEHVSWLTALMADCRREFRGDLDLFLVFSIISDRTREQHGAGADLNIRSIAEFSGIPRETVRRKVEELVRLGLVARASRSTLLATRPLRHRNPAAGDIR